VLFGGNPHATKYRNCAETFYSFKGALTLYPSFDNTNVNTDAAPQVIVNNQTQPFSAAASAGAFKDIDTTYSNPFVAKVDGTTSTWQSNSTITITDITVKSQTLPPQNLGDFVKDVTLLPYMVGRRIAVTAKNLKPNTRLYPFFDKQDVSQYCAPALYNPKYLNSDGTINNDKVIALSNISDPSNLLVQTSALNSQLKTNSAGTIFLIFMLPSNTFRAGERVFTLIDQPDINATDAILTSAEGTYNSSSLATTSQNLSYSVIQPLFTPSTITNSGTPLTWDVTSPPPVTIINNNTTVNNTNVTNVVSGTGGGGGGGHGDNSGTNHSVPGGQYSSVAGGYADQSAIHDGGYSPNAKED